MTHNTDIYRKIPIISPGLIFVQKAFLRGLFLGELIFRGVCSRKEFCVSKWVWLVDKNSLKHYENSLKQLTTANSNSPWAHIQEGLLLEGYLHLRFGGLILGGLIIGIVRYIIYILRAWVGCGLTFF